MDKQCELKLEWIPAAYQEVSSIADDTIPGKLKKEQPVNGIYQVSGKAFAKHKPLSKRKV